MNNRTNVPNILVVDDEARNADLMEAYLFGDHNVIKAYNAKQALKILEKGDINLILLDIMMPDMQGDELCQLLKNNTTTGFIPIVIVTALSSKEDRVNALKAGADDFLTKPVDRTELRIRIGSLLKIKELTCRLRQERNLARTYLDTAGVVLMVVDISQKIALINKKGCEIMGYENESDLIGKNFFDLFIVPEKRTQSKGDHHQFICNNDMELKNYESSIINRTGQTRIINWHNTLLKDKNGTVTGVLRSGEDITEKKAAQEALLKNEEIHEKEIHHRIKNNLQIISSLLDLEARKFTDEKTTNSFKESRNRVQSMAMAHEKLYLSRDMDTIDISDYLRNIANFLYSMNAGNDPLIKMETDLQKEYLDIDTAIHLGLIVNELITNCFKYAFTNRDTGRIQLTFHRKEDEYILTIKDDGTGLSDDLDIRKANSLGLQLVHELTEQIGAKLTIKRENGTAFTLRFNRITNTP